MLTRASGREIGDRGRGADLHDTGTLSAGHGQQDLAAGQSPVAAPASSSVRSPGGVAGSESAPGLIGQRDGDQAGLQEGLEPGLGFSLNRP